MKVLWTDGSAMPNPGMGGYAVIENGRPVRLGKSRQKTTNIRMEAYALLAAMEYAGEEECEIHTDSLFWINVMTKWMKGWERNGWKKADKKPVENLDLVQKLYETYRPDKVKLIWEKGHAGTPDNELADVWANKAREGITK